MTEQEFRRQVAELGFTILTDTLFCTIAEASMNHPIRGYCSVFLGRANSKPLTSGGGSLTGYDDVVSAIREWETLTGITILDPIEIAAKLAEKKP